jgi:tetratricopeptide (TPR) repeat protein
VRNVQLVPDEGAPPRRPWQVLAYGRGTARQRAWVFALLGRQQGLNIVVLSPAPPDATESQNAIGSEEVAEPSDLVWPAVLIEGELYVFDTRLGLPLRDANDAVATLAQLRSDDSLLRRLDLDDAPYPLNAEWIAHMTAQVVADSFDLSRAAFQLEQKLAGENRVALSTNPTQVANALQGIAGIDDVRLWDFPFITLRDQLELQPPQLQTEAMAFEPFAWRPHFWKARVLHFRGRQQTAQRGRLGESQEATSDHQQAIKLYTSKEVRAPERLVQRAAPERQRIASAAQDNAAYWVGLLLYDNKRFDVAAQWLGRKELTAPAADWADGARYNLARAYEALGRREEAIELYEAGIGSQRHGNRLRAKWLKLQPATNGE